MTPEDFEHMGPILVDRECDYDSKVSLSDDGVSVDTNDENNTSNNNTKSLTTRSYILNNSDNNDDEACNNNNIIAFSNDAYQVSIKYRVHYIFFVLQ